MYYFLGIVLQEHITDGSFWPSYVLCQSRLTSEARTGMRVIKQFDGKPSKNLPKILVTEPYGHEALLDFLSVYQTQDKFGGVHYHPKGALCWFSCNKYGDPLGQEIYARNVLVLTAGPKTIRLLPPLVISRAEMDEGLAVLKEVLVK